MNTGACFLLLEAVTICIPCLEKMGRALFCSSDMHGRQVEIIPGMPTKFTRDTSALKENTHHFNWCTYTPLAQGSEHITAQSKVSVYRQQFIYISNIPVYIFCSSLCIISINRTFTLPEHPYRQWSPLLWFGNRHSDMPSPSCPAKQSECKSKQLSPLSLMLKCRATYLFKRYKRTKDEIK